MDSSKSPLAALGGALVVVLLVGIPLAGVGLALVGRPLAPFETTPASLAEVFSESGATRLFLHTLALASVVAVGAGLLGTWLAWIDARFELPGRRALCLAALLPLAMPSYLLAGAAASATGQRGFPIAAAVLIIVTTPLVHLLVGTALVRVSSAEEDAARTLGASRFRVFSVVVLPALRPALALGVLLSLLYAVSDFGAVAVLDVPVLTWRLYDAVRGQELARAAVLGVAVLGATLPLFVAARILRGGAPERSVSNPRPPQRVAPGPLGAILAYGALLGMVGAGLVLPVTVMGGWVTEGITTHQVFADPVGPLVDTLILALGGAVLTLALAWLPAWASGRGRAWMEPLVLFTSALPGVLLALGLVLAALALSRAVGGGEVYRLLLSSGVLLFLGYATRFVAEVFAPLRASILALDDRQIESAQVLGASSATRLRRVVAPALAPGVAVAFLLGFVAILKELPVTLMLGGATGRKTLAFRAWDRYNEALWHDAGVAGLLLVACALLVAAGTLRWRHDV